MNVGAFAVLFVVFPFALVDVAFWGLPDPVAIFFSTFPFTLKLFSFSPVKLADSVSFSLDEMTGINACSGFLDPAGFQT